MYYHVYVHHYPYMVCSIASSMHVYVYYYCYSFMYKEIIMKWIIQMAVRWAIIVACGIVNYIYFW